MPRPHIQVIMGDQAIPSDLHEAVRRTGASASFRPLPEAVRGGGTAAADAVVVVVPDEMRELTRPLRMLFDRLADHPRATLLLKASGGFVPRVAHPQTLPVTFGCNANADELTTRLTTMLEMRASLEALHQEQAAREETEQAAAQRYRQQLRLASQVQRELIPETLPEIGPVSFSVVFRPIDYVSGDIYDVHRLDQTHLAIALADATGHGIPAALLTVFVKRALRGKEITNGHHRILRPEEVLTRLNEDLLAANLSDCSFIAATYAVLDLETLMLSIARAGAPYPIIRRGDGQLELLRPPGSLAGIDRNVRFAAQTLPLAPGDTLLLCSDGLERVALPADHPVRNLPTAGAPSRGLFAQRGNGCGRGAGAGHRNSPNGDAAHVAAVPTVARGVAAAGAGRGTAPPGEAILSSAWARTLRELGPRAALDQIRIRYETLRRMGHPLDDLTIVAMQVRSQPDAQT